MVRAQQIEGIDQGLFLEVVVIPACSARWTSFWAKSVLRSTSLARSLVDADAGAGFVRAVMGAIVHGAAFGGEAIFRPDLVNVDQGALPGAEEQMLEARDRE